MAFEVVNKKFRKHEGDVTLPQRTTAESAGYDFHSMEDMLLVPGQQHIFWTDVKAKLPAGTHLEIHPRSSWAIKKDILLKNQTGIIDKDYHNNESTGGNIAICLRNTSKTDVIIEKGDRIAQGIIIPHVVFDDTPTTVRKGGIGSTGE